MINNFKTNLTTYMSVCHDRIRSIIIYKPICYGLSVFVGDPPEYYKYFEINPTTGYINKTNNITADNPHYFTFVIEVSAIVITSMQTTRVCRKFEIIHNRHVVIVGKPLVYWLSSTCNKYKHVHLG